MNITEQAATVMQEIDAALPMMTDALVGIGKRRKDAIEND